MPMTARLWSLNALAVELDMDRRTVGARLRGVRPDGKLNGHPAWHLTTALRVLRPNGATRAQQPPEPDLPGWARAIVDATRTSFDRGYALALMGAIYECPRVAGGMAVRCGAGLTMDQAFAVSRAVTAGLVHVLFEDAAAFGAEPFASAGADGPDLIATDAFVPLDWRQVAADAGEPGWTPPFPVPGWGGRGDLAEDGGEEWEALRQEYPSAARLRDGALPAGG